jgi:hypothetical protein
LNSDGSIDALTPIRSDDIPNTSLQSGGKIIIGGYLYTFNGTLNTMGTLEY